ncbi:MAG: ATP-binding protein [Phaeodactylibacter sp.]|uniref:ATP-binding protein n=1 Tax=Phaeodactylibacter sp. TaxID=1940289 RepID=UPI0032EFDAF9
MNSKTYYSNFSPTLDNCSEEPIHRPSAIFGGAYLLAIDRTNFTVAGASENLMELLGLEKASFLGQPWKDSLPDAVYAVLMPHIERSKWGGINPLEVEIAGRQFDAIGHQSGEFLIIEFEEQKPDQDLLFSKNLQQIIGVLDDCEDEQELFNQMAQEVKHFSGYDRVMVYRFDEDWNGEVVGEAREAHLEPFFGLRYPKTDIPPIARKLFLDNRSRILPDIYTPHSPIYLAEPYDLPGGLDLSHAQHRATSPIHLEYLHNMGVRATLSVAIIVNQQLWGLIANHHYSAYSIPLQQRRFCEVMAMVFSTRVVYLENQRMLRQGQKYRMAEKAFVEHLQTTNNLTYEAQLWNAEPGLKDLCAADGVALVVGEQVRTTGSTPPKDTIVNLLAILKQREQSNLFVTRSVVETLGIDPDFMPSWPGVMVLGISVEQSMNVLWFKNPMNKTVSWGGNPKEAVLVEKKENDDKVRLSPRKSFAKWQEVVRDKSAPWEEYEVKIAEEFRERLVREELQRSGVAIRALNGRLAATLNKELDQIIYIASHDLQEPLRTIRSFAQLLVRSASAKLTQDELFFLERITLASDRMKMLVTNLLDYSRIGRSVEVEEVNLNQVIQEIREDYEHKIKETRATIHAVDLPVLKGDFIELKRLFQNLISNALKYHKEGVQPVVRVEARKGDNQWLFEVSDNGIGMEEQYLEKIFLLFQRLHSKDEYEGTGIGLAQCKKIVEAYAGDIYAKSKLGEGTTFHLSLSDKKL